MNYSVHITSNWLTLKSGAHYLYVLSNRGEHLRDSGLKRFHDMLEAIIGKSTPEALISYLGCDDFADLTLIYTHESVCLLKTDIIRSYPLFYTKNGHTVYVSDHVVYDPEQQTGTGEILQLLATGMVWGGRTVYEHISAVQAGEIVLFYGDEFRKNRYFTYDYDQKLTWTRPEDKVEACRHFDRIFMKIMEETVESIPEHGRIVVPLSGGHDSRLLVNYLYRIGYRNVLCFSYGTTGNLQASLSRRVAQALGYEWVFVEYTEDKWSELHSNKEIDRYLEFAFRGVSAPHLQDFLAVYELKQRQILKSGDVFMPGHALDFIAGSHIRPFDLTCNDRDEAVRRVVAKFSERTTAGDDTDRLLVYDMHEIYRELPVPPGQFQECFNWQERQAKFIGNSYRVYEYFGFGTRIPYWDIRLIRFWLSADPAIKTERRFFYDMERETLLTDELRRIPFYDEVVRKRQKSRVYRKMIPDFLYIVLVRLLRRKQKLDEGLNQIFAKQADSLSDLINPDGNWPKPLYKLIEPDLKRYPYQIDPHFVTRLYTIKKLLL